jgi:altronate hydrolase
MQQNVLQINPSDNVLVALKDLKKGDTFIWHGNKFELPEDVPGKHKIFTGSMGPGENVIMYGVIVGKVQQPVKPGSRMTVDNTTHSTGNFEYKGTSFIWKPPDISKYKYRTFKGYHRSDGRVGTSNYWIFIPTVFCENRNLDIIKEVLSDVLGYSVSEKYKVFTHQLVDTYKNGTEINEIDFSPDFSPALNRRVFENIDGIKFLNHSGGCGGTRKDAESLGRLLSAYADHPNVAGVTVISLGCQILQVKDFLAYLKERNPDFQKPLLIFEQQQSKSEPQFITQVIRETFSRLAEVNRTERKEAPIGKLSIGVKCGGSDGFSGISANPAVGHCADLLVASGGQVLLAEFPELCGAEQDLIDRSVNEATARKFIRLMTEYNDSALAAGSGFHNNPSPGNIKDGLITDAVKSVGASKKGGNSPVNDVLDYTEPAVKSGLNLVCTPGNDVEATTGQAASGATLILFTTGLGTPTGNPVCPVIKISTNTALAIRMPDTIDIDAGCIIEGSKSIEEVGEEIMEYVIKAASGEVIPKTVLLNQDDFIPWKREVSL